MSKTEKRLITPNKTKDEICNATLNATLKEIEDTISDETLLIVRRTTTEKIMPVMKMSITWAVTGTIF